MMVFWEGSIRLFLEFEIATAAHHEIFEVTEENLTLNIHEFRNASLVLFD